MAFQPLSKIKKQQLRSLLLCVCNALQVGTHDVLNQSRRREASDARNLFIHHARALEYTRQDVADFLDVLPWSITYHCALHQSLLVNAAFAEKANLVEKHLNDA